MGLPWWLSAKESPANAGDGVGSLGQEDPLEKEMATCSSILAGESHGQRSMVGYRQWGRKSRTRLSRQAYCPFTQKFKTLFL